MTKEQERLHEAQAKYDVLLANWKKLIVHSTEQQKKIDQLENELLIQKKLRSIVVK